MQNAGLGRGGATFLPLKHMPVKTPRPVPDKVDTKLFLKFAQKRTTKMLLGYSLQDQVPER